MIPKGKNFIRLMGESPETSILTYNLNVNEAPPGETYQFNPGLVIVGNDFQAENLTIQNTSGDHGQALALRADGDRASFKNCHILGWQDTLMANNGRDYFTNCYVAGRVDFIYGSATVVFDHCEIHSKNGGYLTAASTPENHPYGLVFLHCTLTGDSVAWVNPTNSVVAHPAKDRKAALGRPWRASANVAFLDCWMGDHIQPAGWNNWGKESNEKTARYSEYNSSGPGANPSARVTWAKQLTSAEAKEFTLKNILGGPDNWEPTATKE
jgi:pectinesterase